MNDAIEPRARALAEWLSSPADGAIPDSVDPDVIEAIIVLRPDRAPPHTITVEQVLAAITDGPLMDPAVAADLKRWLDAGPGAAPPPTLPVGVVETTYALRPEMAPSLGVSIDDVLDKVADGPLASPSLRKARRHDQEPTAHGAESTPQESIAQQALVSVRRKRWTGTAVGITAMAAAVVLFAAPITEEAVRGPAYFADDAVALAHETTVTEQPVVLLESRREPTGTVDGQPRGSAADSEAADLKPPAVASHGRPNAAKPRRSPAARGRPTERVDLGDDNGSPTGASLTTPSARATPTSPAIAPSSSGPDTLSAKEATAMLSEPTQAKDDSPTATAVRQARRSRRTINVDAFDVDAAEEATRTEPFAMLPPDSASIDQVDSLRLRRGVNGIQAVQQARNLLDSGQADRALRAVESALKQSGLVPITAARLWRLKAEIFTHLGRSDDAKEARETAAKLDPLR